MRKSIDWREKLHYLSARLFEITFVLYLFYQFMSAIRWNSVFYQSSRIAELIGWMSCCRYLLIPIALEKVLRSPKKGLITLACMALAWFSSRSSHVYNDLFIFFSFLLLSDTVDEGRVLHLNLAAHLGCLLVLAAFLLLERTLGLYYGAYLVAGFNPNTAAAIQLALLLLVWQLWLKRSKVLTFLLFWALVYPVNQFQGSNTTSVLLFLFPILWTVIEAIGKGKHGKILRLTTIVPWVVMAASVGVMLWLASFEVVPYWTTPPWKTFSERFGDAANLVKQHGITIFGSTEGWTLGYTTDNLFLNNLLCHGVVGMLMVAVAFTWSFLRFYRLKRFDLMAVTLLFMIYGVTESLAIVMMFNFVPSITLAGEDCPDFALKQQGKTRGQRLRRRAVLSVGIAAVGAVLALILPAAWEVTEWQNLTEKPVQTSVTERIQPDAEITQAFSTDQPFHGFSILAATYETTPLANLTVSLKDGEGNVLESQSYQMIVRDNSYLNFPFANEYPDGNYTLSVSGRTRHGAVVFWMDDSHVFPSGTPVEPVEGSGNWIMYAVRKAQLKAPGKIWSAALALTLIVMIWAMPLPKKQKSISVAADAQENTPLEDAGKDA